MASQITGSTAGEIVASVRRLVDSGQLSGGDVLPSSRALAGELDVNRNTVMAAFKLLASAGVVVTRGRGGTVIAEPVRTSSEGFAQDTVLRDVANGNPDVRYLPDLRRALSSMPSQSALYGQPVMDSGLAQWASEWISQDVAGGFEMMLASGAVDAVERLLSQSLAPGDAVGLEDPCYLTSVHTAQVAGYRIVPIPVDGQGMTVQGLRHALQAGVRAVVCTPRAQNPTGASITPQRAAELARELEGHPYVLAIADDHFSMLATTPYCSVIGPEHQRWALVRSVSKFLGPDLRLAFVAADHQTAQNFNQRMAPGTMWVSHLLQKITKALLTDAQVVSGIDRARSHYASRNEAFARMLADKGVGASAGDGLNLWVDTGQESRIVVERLMKRGWLARPGKEFSLSDGTGATHVRLTVHDLNSHELETLADDLAVAINPRTTRSLI